MNRATMVFLLSAFVTCLASHALGGNGPRITRNQAWKDRSSSSDIIPGVVVVKLKRNSSLPGVQAARGPVPLPNAFSERGVTSMARAFPFVKPLNDGDVASGKIDLSQIHFAAIPPDLDPRDVASRLAQLPQVEYAEPKYYSYLCDVPNDSDYSATQQVYFDRMNVAAGWAIQKGSPSVVIATVDGGTDWLHPDLLPNIWVNPGEDLNHDGIFERFPPPGGDINEVDDDHNGFIDDVVGWNFTNTTNDPRGFLPGNADHGTKTASVFGAVTNNLLGMAGTSWNCRIMAVCAADPVIENTISHGPEGIAYAAENGARVINCSWGHLNHSQYEQDIITYATINKRALVVAAVDDHHGQTDFDNIPFYPAAYKHVLSVGATADTSDALAYFSQYGVTISVFAPGMRIHVALNNDSYGTDQGTSFSSPLVAGLAGLLVAAHPDWGPDTIAEQIRMTADPIDASNPNYAGSLGRGRVNFGRALSEVHSGVTITDAQLHTPSGGIVFIDGDTLILSLTLKNILFAPAQNLSFSVSADSALLPLGVAHAPTSLSPGGEDSVEFTFKVGKLTQKRDVSIELRWVANADDRDALAFKTTLYPQFAPSPWVVQHAPVLSQPDPNVGFSAVDSNVCWGIIAGNTFNSRQSPQIFRTTNGGNSWDSVTVPGGASGLEGSSIAAIDANTAWAVMWDRSGATSGGVFKTTNAGLGWTKDTTLFAGSGAWPKGIHFFDSNNGVAFGNPRGGFWEIYTTMDGGAHWIRVPSGNIPPVADLGSGDFSLTGAFATIGNTLWFGTFLLRSVYKTTDGGITWSVARHVLGSDGGGVLVAFKDDLNGLACSPFNDTGGNRIYRTTDGGATWTSLAPGSIPATPSANFIAYNPGSRVYVIASHDGNDYYIGKTISGSAYSTDDGTSWKQTDSLPHGPPTFISSGIGWSDGANDVVYKWDKLVGSVRQSKVIAEGFRLEQNYPNPFNPSTDIRYQIADNKMVRLTVYDILGREVTVLVNERKAPGTYTVQFDGSGLASGVYFYRLTAGSFVQTRKLLLLR